MIIAGGAAPQWAQQLVTDLNAFFSRLGTASTKNVGTTAGNVVQLDATGKLPAVDGSQLTGFGTAASKNVGTAPNNVVQLDGSSKLPPVDGSQLTGLAASVLRSYLAGLTLSTAGASTTFSVAPGVAADSTNAVLMSLASAISKTTSAWVVGTGNGALDTGTIANSTWYSAFLIKRLDTGVVDPLISLSATTPLMPTNYTVKRRLGSMKTNGSGQWTAFIQDGDLFQWVGGAIVDISAANPGTAAVNRTLSVPTGVPVIANMQVGFSTLVLTSNPAGILISDLAVTDIAPTTANATALNYSSGGTAANFYVNAAVRTNTSAQVRSRLQVSDANITLNINTVGWSDRRGRDA